jgi:transcriptional regulator with XRE-family HTH domain
MGYTWAMTAAISLREARRRAGLTQVALARRAGTSQATISAYESGRKQPTVETFSRLLLATGSRLSVIPAQQAVLEPSAAQQARAGRALVDVIALAAALPTRHERELRFPRLAARERRAA